MSASSTISSASETAASELAHLQAQHTDLVEKLEYWKAFAESEGRARLAAEARLVTVEEANADLKREYRQSQMNMARIAVISKNFLHR